MPITAIHAMDCSAEDDVDGRVEPGHDEAGSRSTVPGRLFVTGLCLDGLAGRRITSPPQVLAAVPAVRKRNQRPGFVVIVVGRPRPIHGLPGWIRAVTAIRVR